MKRPHMILASICLMSAAASARGGLNNAERATLGEAAWTEYLARAPASDARAGDVDRVAQRLIEALPRSAQRWDWQHRMIAGDRPDAWALPGGGLALTEALLAPAQTEAGLAALLAHQLAHVTAGHGGRRIHQQLVLTGLLSAEQISLADADYGPEILSLLGLGTRIGVVLPFSREHELEADAEAMLLMADAGYDPAAAIGAWERLAETTEDTSALSMTSTHPPRSSRIRAMEEALPAAQKRYARADTQLGLGSRVAP